MTKPTASQPDRLYTREFFQVFAAVGMFMTGTALQFHFGQYMAHLGHGVDVLGRVLSMAMIGTLLIRLQIGRWIDRFGCRRTWIVATFIAAAAIGTVQFSANLGLIVVLRTAASMAQAAAMTTVAVFATQIAPPHRRAESLGTMGLSGFTGMVLGPTIGDWIFSGEAISMGTYRMFFTASCLCCLAGGLVLLLIRKPITATGTESSPHHQTTKLAPHVSTWAMLRRHWPGTVLLVAVLFAMTFSIQMSFLERMAEERGFKNIKWFFLSYGPTAMVLRILFRQLPQTIGRTRTMVFGMGFFALGVYVLAGASSQWSLVLPGCLMGTGHCFVFPSMVDLAAQRFPSEHRGLGTSVVLGAFDAGLLAGYGAMGEVINAFGFESAFTLLATTIAAATILFAVRHRENVIGRGWTVIHSTR